MPDRNPIPLYDSSLEAAKSLIELKETFVRKRRDIFARYEEEMKLFTSLHLAEVEHHFSVLHSDTQTDSKDGWAIDATEGQITLVPVYSQPVIEAMMQRSSNPVH